VRRNQIENPKIGRDQRMISNISLHTCTNMNMYGRAEKTAAIHATRTDFLARLALGLKSKGRHMAWYLSRLIASRMYVVDERVRI